MLGLTEVQWARATCPRILEMSEEVLQREPGETAQHWYNRLMNLNLWEYDFGSQTALLELIARLRRRAARLAKDEEAARVA